MKKKKERLSKDDIKILKIMAKKELEKQQKQNEDNKINRE